jgi:GT2 family glycosyltransferase
MDDRVVIRVSEITFSVVIPYKRRLRNLNLVLESLTEQTMGASRFEVVVGAMEYSQDYLATCQKFTDRLNLVSVMIDADWNFSRARNIGMRQAGGDVIVCLDADVALPPRGLESLRDRYYLDRQDSCVLGQLIGYDNLTDELPGNDADTPYSHYRPMLAELDATHGLRSDERWRFEPVVLPWTMVWTGLVSVPGAAVRQQGIFFDEDFSGWGGEDQEWGYRLGAAGVRIVRGVDFYGLHLPHVRNVKANLANLSVNKTRFLAKWPTLEVELYRAFDSWDANRLIAEATREVARAAGGAGSLGVARGTVGGVDTIAVGVVLDDQRRLRVPGAAELFDDGVVTWTTPLVGMALPLPDQSIAQCRVLPPVLRLSERYREVVLREAARVAGTVTLPAENLACATSVR